MKLSLFTGSRVEFSKWLGHPPVFYLQLVMLITVGLYDTKSYPYTTLEPALLPVWYGNGRQTSELSTQYFKDLISSNLLKPIFFISVFNISTAQNTKEKYIYCVCFKHSHKIF